jgi:hypothetical protein
MSTDIKEQLSALMDGELGRDERAFLMRRLEHDAELRAVWTRLHLMRDVMTNHRGSAPLDLSSRVMAALADEDRMQETAVQTARRGRWRPWAGAALAACVALVAVMVVTPQAQFADTGLPEVATAAPAPRLALPANVPGPMVPAWQAGGADAQPVAAEQRRDLLPQPTPMSAEDVMLLRHGQVAGASWLVGGDQHLYGQSDAAQGQLEVSPAAYQPQ